MNIINTKYRWDIGAALRNAGMFSITKSFQEQGDCMQCLRETQAPGAVKEFTSGSLPFENGEFEHINEFGRVTGRSSEEKPNATRGVWQDFVGAPSEVRKAGTIKRKNVLQSVQMRLGAIKK